jgi:hypothetical protein
MVTDEDRLRASERDMWEKGDWIPAILSFLSRHCFLHLLRVRDAARNHSLSRRVIVAAFFYPAYVVAFVVWVASAALLTLLFPVLFFVGRTQRMRTP